MKKYILGAFLTLLLAAQPVFADSIYCSCVRTLNKFVPTAPLVNAEFYQTIGFRTTPQVGGIALFSYGLGTLKQHVAYIAYMDALGMELWEGNREECTFTKRWIRWDTPDPYLIGFTRM